MGDPVLGQRIREARQAAHLTQPELAARVGLKHSQSISNYERGTAEVKPDRLRRIATATSKPLSFFLDAPATDDVSDPVLRQLVREELEGFLADSLEPLLRRLLDLAPQEPHRAGSAGP